MNTQNTDFTPMIIGEPDNQRKNQVADLYNEICGEVSNLKAQLQMMFAEDEELITFDFLSELLTSDPEIFIRTRWVAHKGISIPGINKERLIASDLLEIPKYFEIIESLKVLKELFAKAKSLKFNYPLDKLQDSDLYFSLNEEFHRAFYESEIIYTENEQQNRVLEAVTELKNAINKLCKLQILPVNNLSHLSYRYDRFVLKRTNNPDEPFELNPTMFKTTLRNLPKV